MKIAVILIPHRINDIIHRKVRVAKQTYRLVQAFPLKQFLKVHSGCLLNHAAQRVRRQAKSSAKLSQSRGPIVLLNILQGGHEYHILI